MSDAMRLGPNDSGRLYLVEHPCVLVTGLFVEATKSHDGAVRPFCVQMWFVIRHKPSEVMKQLVKAAKSGCIE